MKHLPKVRAAIEKLKTRTDVQVEIKAVAWIIHVTSADALACEVTVPRDWCFEWFVTVKRIECAEDVWRDSTEHYGAPDEALDAEMAADILSFVDRATKSNLLNPISLHEHAE